MQRCADAVRFWFEFLERTMAQSAGRIEYSHDQCSAREFVRHTHAAIRAFGRRYDVGQQRIADDDRANQYRGIVPQRAHNVDRPVVDRDDIAIVIGLREPGVKRSDVDIG